MDYRINNIVPFSYMKVTVLAASASNQQDSLTLDQDSQFELHQIFASATSDADTDFMPNGFEVLIIAGSGGRMLANLPIPQRCMCSPSNGGYRLLRPILFPPQTNLQLQYNEISTSTNTVKLVFHGFKIFGSLQ